MPEETKTADVVVVTMSDSGCQAVYIDGEFSECEDTLYACDIARAVGGRPMVLRAVEAEEIPGDEVWPDKLDDLENITYKEPDH